MFVDGECGDGSAEARDATDEIAGRESDDVDLPARAIGEMLSVLRCGGYLSLSTPNVVWNPIVRLASAVRLRPFEETEERPCA